MHGSCRSVLQADLLQRAVAHSVVQYVCFHVCYRQLSTQYSSQGATLAYTPRRSSFTKY